MTDERDLVRSVTRTVVARLGSAGPDVVEAVVAEVLASLTAGDSPTAAAGPVTTPRGATLLPTVGAHPSVEVCLSCVEQEKARRRSRAVLTTTGRNTRGIVATVTARIADLGGDILDISQTLVSDFFTMIIVIDVGQLNVSFERFRDDIQAAVKSLGCNAMMMHEDVMSALHRV